MREVLRAVDEAIDGAEIFGTKAIMRVLRDAGIADDSIVIFLSDNGLMWGEHRVHRKGKPYEETIRTPMLVRYPKLAPLPHPKSDSPSTSTSRPCWSSWPGNSAPMEEDPDE
jgi:hypothetical protein